MKKEKGNIFGHDIDKEKLLIGAAVGGVVLAGLGLYFLSGSSSSKKKKTTTSGKSVPPSSRLLVVFNNRFEDLNSCPGEDLNNLFVTSDSETLKLYPKLKAGAQLIKLNNEKVAGLSFKEILQKISTAAIPITTQFLENPELEKAWKEAEDLKIKANEMNKQKSDPDRYQKALDLYSQAIKLHPTRKEYYGNRVLMYFGQKDFQKALSDCEQFKPFDPHGRWQRGMHLRGLVYNYLQNHEAALECFKQVVAIDPEHRMAGKARTRINQLESKIGAANESETIGDDSTTKA